VLITQKVKTMLAIDIPGFGNVELEHLVSDFTGTLSVDGKLLPGVNDRLKRIGQFLNVYIITADTFGTVKQELKDVHCTIKLLSPNNEDTQKEKFVQELGAEQVVAFGNGNNDRRMLKTARLGIAVIEGEGASVEAITTAHIAVRNILDAFGLLLNPKRCKATLRF
jgi:soluble P-type ATPase